MGKKRRGGVKPSKFLDRAPANAEGNFYSICAPSTYLGERRRWTPKTGKRQRRRPRDLCTSISLSGSPESSPEAVCTPTTQKPCKAVITIAIRLRYVYDTTTTKNWHVNFLLASNRVEWKQARVIRRSRIVVVSQPISQLRFDYDKTTIRRIRRYHDAFDYDGLIEITIRLRYDYDVSRAPSSIRRDSTRAKN